MRLIPLVFIAVVLALILILHNAKRDRDVSAESIQEDAQRIVEMTSARYLKSTGRFQAKKLRAQRNRPGIGDLRKDCSRCMAGGFGLKAKTEKAQHFFFSLPVVSLSSGLH